MTNKVDCFFCNNMSLMLMLCSHMLLNSSLFNLPPQTMPCSLCRGVSAMEKTSCASISNLMADSSVTKRVLQDHDCTNCKLFSCRMSAPCITSKLVTLSLIKPTSDIAVLYVGVEPLPLFTDAPFSVCECTHWYMPPSIGCIVFGVLRIPWLGLGMRGGGRLRGLCWEC